MTNIIRKNKDIFINNITNNSDSLNKIMNIFNESESKLLLENLISNDISITEDQYNKLYDQLLDNKKYIYSFKSIIDRLYRNIEDGNCSKCACDVGDNKFILKCCNIMICEDCLLKVNSNMFIDRCPSCCNQLVKRNILLLDSTISLDDMKNTSSDEIFNILLENVNTENENMFNNDDDLIDKDRAILDIISNKEPQNCTKIFHTGFCTII